MPKRTNPGAHSDAKQELRQLLDVMVDPSAAFNSSNVRFNVNYPSTLPEAALDGGGTFQIRVDAKDLDGQPLRYFNGPGAIVTLTATTVGDGAVVSPSTVEYVNGVGLLEVTVTGTWAAGDTISIAPLFFHKGAVISNATANVPQTFPATITAV